MKITDVKAWVVSSGIGHAVKSSDGCWTYTACQSFGTYGAVTAEKPSKICRRCRKALVNMTPHVTESAAPGA